MGDNKPWQFQKGHPGGPGRPPKAREAAYLAILREEAGLSDWRAIVKKQVDAAKTGDLDAAKWIADYAIGRPKQGIAIEHTDADTSGEWDGYTDEQLRAILAGADASTVAAGTGAEEAPAQRGNTPGPGAPASD